MHPGPLRPTPPAASPDAAAETAPGHAPCGLILAVEPDGAGQPVQWARRTGLARLLGVALVAALCLAPAMARAQACDTGLDADCDGDLFTIGEGDCDDLDPAVYPGAKEVCDDRLDNDCDGFYDEGCDQAIRQGSARGGGGCTGGNAIGDGSTAAVLLPLLLLARRREERA